MLGLKPPVGLNLSIAERLNPSIAHFLETKAVISKAIRVAIPGIVQSFDSVHQTVTVQAAIKEYVRNNGVLTADPIALLTDVPIQLPRGGGCTLTLPIAKGDECLLVISDVCLDSWWQSGGTNNIPMSARRHRLSDAIAIFGIWSQPRVLSDYSTNSAQLRRDDGTVVIDIASNQITLTAPTVTVSAETVNVTGSSQVNISGDGNTTIESRVFLEHTHSGVTAGGAVSGPVV